MKLDVHQLASHLLHDIEKSIVKREVACNYFFNKKKKKKTREYKSKEISHNIIKFLTNHLKVVVNNCQKNHRLGD